MKTLENENRVEISEGIAALASSLNECVNLFFQVGAMRGKDKNALLLLNLEGSFISSKVKEELENFFQNNFKKYEAVAVYGVGRGVRKLILQSLKYSIYI